MPTITIRKKAKTTKTCTIDDLLGTPKTASQEEKEAWEAVLDATKIADETENSPESSFVVDPDQGEFLFCVKILGCSIQLIHLQTVQNAARLQCSPVTF